MHGCSQDNMAAPSMETLERAAARTIELARERGLTLGCAESCTGGLVSAALTRIPGSSAVVRGGVVSYALDVKHAVLGVDQAILDDPAQGAVCAQCARQMGHGAHGACTGSSRVTGRRCATRPSLSHSISCVENLGFNASHVALVSRTWRVRGLSSCLLTGPKLRKCDESASQPQAQG